MGLSRNKVAVSEGAAGSPPFYGERVIGRDRYYVTKRRQKKFDERILKNRIVVQYSRSKGFLRKRRKSVLQTQRVHLYPFRTQKLSSAVVKIIYGRLYGKIAQC